jgi:hypothetical protein
LIYPDGMDGFQINCGVRIRGGWSRNDSNPKRAFRWFFRSEYGNAKLRYPLFGDEGVDEFDNVDLRTSMNYSWSYGAEDPSKNTMNRDVFSRDMQRDMGQPYTRSRYYHLYINGTYWGLYQTQERSEASFAASYFGGDREDYDVVKVDAGYMGLFDIEATDGTLDAWKRLWDASMAGFNTPESYYKIQGLNTDGTRNPDYEVLLDVDNLIDFMLTVFLTGEADGPVSGFRGDQEPNNFYAIYNHVTGDRGFIFFRHDAEHTLGAQPWGYDRTGPFPGGSIFKESNPQWIHQQLVENPLYRARIADRVYKHFFNGGALTPEANIERFLSRKEEIDLAIIAESARWGDSKREPAFTRDNAWLVEINRIVGQFFPDRTKIVLNQIKSKGWYPRIDPPVFNARDSQVQKGFELTISVPLGAIYYTVDGTDPYEPLEASTSYSTLVAENSTKKVLIPTENVVSTWRRNLDFDDSGWHSGNGGVGYEQGSGYENTIDIDVGDEMVGNQTSCYVRIPFSVDGADVDQYNLLTLRMLYDDGFIAFLNGSRVAEVNAPQPFSWNSAATENHEAEGWEFFDITSQLSALKAGDNLLAVHGLNVNLTSSDFLIGAELIAGISSNSGTVSAGAREYTAPLTIEETTQVKARAMEGNNWSALSGVRLYVLEGMENLRITEIHYHPVDADDIENDDGEYEFIELKNIGNETLDLSGVNFSRGIAYAFSQDTALPPGQLVVLASNDSAFYGRYGFHAFDEYEGQLDNSGETIALNSAGGDTLLKIRYNDKYPWPGSADGKGYSLVPNDQNPYRDPNDSQNWCASSVIHGTPGGDDPGVQTRVQERPHTGTPDRFVLDQNYPNPFNSVTTIGYSLPQASRVRLEVFNILGQHVITLVDGQMGSGNHTVRWDASQAATGIYIYRIEAGHFTSVKKLLLVR